MNGKSFKQKYYPKNKKKKLILEFDENARREFLTGFRKRNLQRKARAAEELKKKLKLESKKIKKQTKMFYKKLVHSQKPVPEISHLITENIDMGDHCVTVTEISPLVAAQECSWIGQNQVCYENNNEVENQEENETNADEEDIDGMEIQPKNLREINNLKIKTTKDLKKVIKRQATQNVKQSKIYRTKSKVAQIKNMKRKKREERIRRRKSKMVRTRDDED